jgi:hypothetical protein
VRIIRDYLTTNPQIVVEMTTELDIGIDLTYTP